MKESTENFVDLSFPHYVLTRRAAIKHQAVNHFHINFMSESSLTTNKIMCYDILTDVWFR